MTASPDTNHDDDSQELEPIPQSHALVPAPTKLRSNFFARVIDWLGLRDNANIREDIEDALSGSEGNDADLSISERQMLNNVLRLREVRVADVMIPRGEIEAIDMKTPLGELLKLFEQSGHSRMPVYMDSLDDPRGMVHIRDIVAHITKVSQKAKRRKRDANGTLEPKGPSDGASTRLDLSKVTLDSSIAQLKLYRQVLFVPPSMLVADLMSRMQAQRIQMALVIDEYGGTDGLVSLEDIVEVIVGDIEDEHDDDDAVIEQVSENVIIADARTEIDDIAAIVGQQFKDAVQDSDIDTLGGLIFQALGRIPARREIIKAIPGYEFEVLNVDARRIHNVQIRVLKTHDPRRRSVNMRNDETPVEDQ